MQVSSLRIRLAPLAQEHVKRSSRHCERSEAIQGQRDAASVTLPLDCFVAPLLAMTMKAKRGR